MSTKKISEGTIQLILEKYRDNKSVEKTAAETGVSTATVIRYLKKAGAYRPRKGVSEHIYKQFPKEYLAGMAIRQIAKKHGISRTTVNNRLVEQGITIREPGGRKTLIPNRLKQKWETMSRSGVSSQKIFQEAGEGYGKDIINRYLRENNIPGEAEHKRKRARLAYDLRKKGLYWHEIAEALGYCNASSSYTAARVHALDNNRHWPLKREISLGEQAYEMKLRGRTWTAIAKDLKLSSAKHATVVARRYAIKRKYAKPRHWPLENNLSPEAAEAMQTGIADAKRTKVITSDYLSGISLDATAKKHGISSSRVRKILVEAGIPRRKAVRRENLGRNARIIQDYQAGYSLSETGKRHNLTGQAVQIILKRAGIPRRPQSYNYMEIRPVTEPVTQEPVMPQAREITPEKGIRGMYKQLRNAVIEAIKKQK